MARMRRIGLALALLALTIGLAIAACGGGDDDDGDASPTVPAGDPTALPREVDDEAYLAVLCSGLESFSNAINTEPTEEGISRVIVAFIEDLEAVEPPEDVRPFHLAFIGYLQEAVDDPTRPLTTEPPLPDEDVRDRLAEKERRVDECRDATFFAATSAE